MSVDSTNGGGNVNMMRDIGPQGDDDNEHAHILGHGIKPGVGGQPEQRSKLLLKKIGDAFAHARDKMSAGLSNFRAMTDRTLARVSPFQSKSSGPTPTESVRSARTNEVTNDAVAGNTQGHVNGVTQEKLHQNMALIDKMTAGDTKLPENVKTMIGLSPTLMAHLEKYDADGYTFHIVSDTPDNRIMMEEPEFGDISLSQNFMGQLPLDFVDALATTLIEGEVDALHPVPLIKEGKYNKDDIIDLGRAMRDPFGIRESMREDESGIDVHVEHGKNKYQELPRVKQELSHIKSERYDLTEPTMIPARVRKNQDDTAFNAFMPNQINKV